MTEVTAHLRTPAAILETAALLLAANAARLPRTIGIEQSATIIASMFLNGARRPRSGGRR
jgi:hypothetical protein